MTNEEIFELGIKTMRYVNKFNVPIDYLFEILEDQKVTPMIRGKAMEYNAYLLLEHSLPKTSWSVQKLNLNAQPGFGDEDISITHRRTGIILKVESKSAVRGSISSNTRTRIVERRNVSGFNVKCHRSRSNISLADTSNDRYHVNSFDVIVTNVSNAIFQGGTVGETLEIVHDESLRQMLHNFYQTHSDDELRRATENDWRFCIPADIADNDYIPRTPFVRLENDTHWRPFNEIEQRLHQVVEAKRRTQTAIRR